MTNELLSNLEPSQSLFPEERRKIIQQMLRESGSVRTTALAEQMNVNPATVRRDLLDMSEDGEIRLVHGGAIQAAQVHPVTMHQDLTIKRTINIEAKLMIAKKAASLISDGDIVAFNSGSTIELIVDNLPPDFKSLTVVALSLNVAYKAAQHSYVNLIVPGGIFRRSSQAFVGASAINFLSMLRVDKGFFGAQAVDINAGFTESNLDQVATDRQLINICSHRYLVADSSKFGQVAVGQISELDELDGLIVDDHVPESIRSWAVANGVPLI
jgi:DeoR/GlpR family transcriptional regulator of sugar metabolism